MDLSPNYLEMNISVGIDIEGIDKFKNLVEKYGKNFLGKIFTDKEIEKIPSKNKFLYYALGFSFKESIWKALPTKIQKKVFFKDIEVIWQGQNPFFKIKNFYSDYALNFFVCKNRKKKFVITLVFLFRK